MTECQQQALLFPKVQGRAAAAASRCGKSAIVQSLTPNRRVLRSKAPPTIIREMGVGIALRGD